MIALLTWFAIGYCLTSIHRRRPSFGCVLAVGMAVYITVGFLAAAVSIPQLTTVLLPLLALPTAILLFLFPSKDRRATPAAPPGSNRRFLVLEFFTLLFLTALLYLQVGYPLVNYDVLSYHVPLAAAFAGPDGGHGILLNPDTFYARMPLGAPILQAPLQTSPLIAFSLQTGLQALVFISLFAMATTASRLTYWLGGRRLAGLLATVLVLSLPMNVNALRAGLFDPLLALFALAAFELFILGFRSSERWESWLLAGILLGASVALKLNAVGVVLIPLLAVGCLLVLGARNIQPMKKGLAVGLLLVGVTFTILPWMARGLPVGPFAKLDSQWTSTQAAFVVDVHEPIPPLSPTWWSDFVYKLKVLGYDLPMVGIPLLLVFAILAVRRRGRAGLELWLVLAALAGFSAWLCVRHNPARFLVPASLLLVPPAAVYLARPLMLRGPARWSLLAGFLLIAWVPAIIGHVRILHAHEPAFSPEKREQLETMLIGEPVMQITRLAREEIDRGGKVLLFFEARMGLFPEGATGRTVWDQPSWTNILKRSRNSEEFKRNLINEGFTTILVNEFEWGRLLDFYAADAFPHEEEPLRGRIGLTSRVVLPETIRLGLAEFPPHRFAGLTDRDLTILHDFLLTSRRGTPLATTAGAGAEIWFARLNENAPSNS